MDVRPLGAADLPDAEVLLDGLLAGRMQARLGETHDVLAPPGLCVRDGDRLAGLATWSGAATAGRAELAALAVAVTHQGRGVGAALVEAVAAAPAPRVRTRSGYGIPLRDELVLERGLRRHIRPRRRRPAGVRSAAWPTRPTSPSIRSCTTGTPRRRCGS